MGNTYSASIARASSQSLTASDSASLSITGDITIELWVNITALPPINDFGMLVNKDATGAQRSYSFYLANIAGVYKLYAYVFQQGGATQYSSVWWDYTLSTGAWHHLALSVVMANAIATKMTLYVDGVSQGNGTGNLETGGGATAILDSTAILEIGTRLSTLYYDGKIDEIRIWSAARTANEINTYKSMSIDSAVNLAASYHLDNSLVDSSGNGNTLTNVNSVTFTTSIPYTDSFSNFFMFFN